MKDWGGGLKKGCVGLEKRGGARKLFFLIPHVDPKAGGEEETKKKVMTWKGGGKANTYVMSRTGEGDRKKVVWD